MADSTTEEEQGQSGEEAAATLGKLTGGTRNPGVVFALADLGVPEVLADGPKTPAEIAEATGAHSGALARLLRAIGDTELFTVDPQGRYALTPASDLLRRGHPAGRRSLFLWGASPSVQRAWASLGHSLRTGESAFKHANGVSQWDYNRVNPSEGALFDEMLSVLRPNRHSAVVESYDFAGRTIVDVGAGYGQLIEAILKTHPATHAIAFDAAPVLDGTKQLLSEAGVLDRCELTAGDFFVSVPAGGDVYVLSDILHDWGDSGALKILMNCRNAMRQDSRLLIVEYVMPEKDTPPHVLGMDLMMLVMYGEARQRTKAEFEELFAAAGLEFSSVIPTADAEIVEAVRASAG